MLSGLDYALRSRTLSRLIFSRHLNSGANVSRYRTPSPARRRSFKRRFLPSTFDFYEDSGTNRDLYRWATMQQLAFSRFDTLSFSIAEARRRFALPIAAASPLSQRDSELEQFYKHFPIHSLARVLFFIIEEARVGNLMVTEFPGASRLRQLYQQYRLQTIEIPQTFPETALVNVELALLEPSAMRDPFREFLAIIFSPRTTVYDAAQATIACYQFLFNDLNSEEHATDSVADMGDSLDLSVLQRAARLEEWEQEVRELDASLLAMTFDEGVDAQQTVDEAIDGTERETVANLQRERDQKQRKVDMERSLLSSYDRKQIADSTRFRYDEWDYRENVWLKGWCSVFELREDHAKQESAPALLKRVKPLVPAVRKRFEQVKPIGSRRIPKSLDGDELDMNAIVESRTDLRAGLSPSENIYIRTDYKIRDVAACLLVDLSASTDDPITKPDPVLMPEDAEDPFDDPYLHGAIDFDPEQLEAEPPRKIIDVQKESVLLLATALETLGDLYSIYGFSGYGRERVEFHIAKDFNESLNARTINSVAAMSPLRSTRMGPAIRHATHKLLGTGGSLKVLIVISDGFPQDCDYGPDRGDHEYGIQDTAKALQEARDKGIQPFCITVDVSGHDYLRRMCRDDQYWVIEEIEELPNALQFAYRRLTS